MKILHIFALAAVVAGCVSCSGKPELSYMPAKEASDANWGLIGADGEFLFADEFKRRPSAVVNGVFFVEENNRLTVYKADKNPKQVGDLTGLKDCGYYNNGLMPVVYEGENITFVDKDGKSKFTLDKVNGVNVKCVLSMFINERCAFSTVDGKWGVIDTNGNVVIEPKYSQPIVFLSDRSLASEPDSGKSVILDKNGDVIITLDDEMLCNAFIDGYAYSRIGGYSADSRCVMVKSNGEVIKLPRSVREVRVWDGDYIVFLNENGDSGIMNYDGEVLVRPKYEWIDLLPNGEFIGRRDDKYMFIKPDGETEKVKNMVGPAIGEPYLFSKIFDFDFELVSRKNGKYMLRTYNGDKVGSVFANYRDSFNINSVFSDYFDYEDASHQFTELFDANGVKGYSFGSQMSNYVDPSREISWYRGDSSININLETDNSYFYVSSATIYADYNIIYDSTPYQSYYTWEFYPQSRVDRISFTLTFYGDNYREGVLEHFAKALSTKYGVDLTINGSSGNYISSNGYDSVTVNIENWGAEASDTEGAYPDSVAIPDSIAA